MKHTNTVNNTKLTGFVTTLVIIAFILLNLVYFDVFKIGTFVNKLDNQINKNAKKM